MAGLAAAMVSVMASGTQSLPATVELQDLQTGFAGTTGTVWTIATDGTFTVADKTNDRVDLPRHQGKLDQQQLARLAESLRAADAEQLPARIGEQPPVNPRSITLRIGSKISTLILAGGPDDQGSSPADPHHPQARLLAVAATIKDLLGTH